MNLIKTVFFALAFFCGAALSEDTGTSNGVKWLEIYSNERESSFIGNHSILLERINKEKWTLIVTEGKLEISARKNVQTTFKVYKYSENQSACDKQCNELVFYIFEVNQSEDGSAVGQLIAVSGNQIKLQNKTSEWNPNLTKIRSDHEFIFRLGFHLKHPLSEMDPIKKTNEKKIFGLEVVTGNDESETQQWIVKPKSKKLSLTKPTMNFSLHGFFKLIQH